MSEMVDRVAMAIHAARRKDGSGGPPWHDYGDAGKALRVAEARAAIEAMRIPKAHSFCPDINDAVFNRMIDAAL